MSTILRRFAISISAVAGLLLPGAVLAQDSYPSRSVTIIVPTAPGGGVDFIARLLASEFEKALGQPFLVENVPGANGNIGNSQVARSDPDGYTLLIASSGFMLSPATYKNAPYDPVADFEPIADLAEVPYLFVANKDAGLHSVADVIARAKADPDELIYASQVGGPPNLMTEAFKLSAGINLTHLPTTGGGPNMLALLTGDAQVSLGSLPNFYPQVKDGELVALAVTGRERWPALPDVPTMNEQEFANFFPDGTHVFVAAKGTPQAVIDILSQQTMAILDREDIRQTLLERGFVVVNGGPDALGKRIVEDAAAYLKVVEAINFERY